MKTEKEIVSICITALWSLVVGAIFAIPCYFYFADQPIYLSICIGCAYALFWYFCVLNKLMDDIEDQLNTVCLSILIAAIPTTSIFIGYNHAYHFIVILIVLWIIPFGIGQRYRDDWHQDDDYDEFVGLLLRSILSLIVGVIFALICYFRYKSIDSDTAISIGVVYSLFWFFGVFWNLSEYIGCQFKTVALTLAISVIPILSLYISGTIAYKLMVVIIVIVAPIIISRQYKD
jgi:hypothetical protein